MAFYNMHFAANCRVLLIKLAPYSIPA